MWSHNNLCVFVSCTCIVLLLASGVVANGYEQPYYSHSNGGFYGDNDGYQGSDWGVGGGLQQQNCIEIPQNMSLCKNIGYHKMRIPNLLDHDTLREVTQQSVPWVPLLGIRCHPDTKLFLCSLFSPVCLDRPIWPCRSLCEAVKNGCETLMLKYGFPWPEMLRCDKFPADNDLCINLQHNNAPAVVETPKEDESVCKPCKYPDTYEAIADHFCGAEFVLRIEIDEHVVSGSDLKIIPKKKKKVQDDNISRRDFRNLVLYVKNGTSCDCDQIQETETGGKKAKREYLVMGSRQGSAVTVSYLIHLDLSVKDVKKAWKVMRKGKMCENGLPSLPSSNKGRKKKGKGRGRKDRKSPTTRVTLAPPVDISTAPNDGKHHGNTGSNNNHANTNVDNDRRRPTEPGKKRRKNCKNPKKCTSTAPGTVAAESNRKPNRDRTERRKNNRKGSRA